MTTNTENTVTNEVVTACMSAIKARTTNVLNVLAANSAKPDQFVRQYKRLSNEKLVAALVERFNVDASYFAFIDDFKSQYDSRAGKSYLAVYALEKHVDMLYACAGMSKYLDSYSRAIITNAQTFKDKTIDYALCTASLCKEVKIHEDTQLNVRLLKADTTASTQRSSTKSALIALRAASYDATSKTLTLDTKNAMFKALAKAAF
jgi:hypothetical protein